MLTCANCKAYRSICYYKGSVESKRKILIEDSVAAGRTIDEATVSLEAERQRFEFFKRYDLIDTGRYWLNRDLKRCLVDDGKVIVIDE